MSSTYVVPDGVRPTPHAADSPQRGRGRRVAAALLGVLAVVALAIGENGGTSLVSLADTNLIESHLDAWYRGDYALVQSLRAPQKLRTGPPEERVEGELRYQALLEAEADLVSCQPSPPSTLRCDVAYANAMSRAIGKEPVVIAQQFGIEDGLITFVAGPYPQDEAITESFRKFAVLLYPTEYESACLDEPGYQPPSCAEFKMDRLEDWSTWHQREHA